MNERIEERVARRPRHRAAGSAELQVVVERTSSAASEPVEVDLLDLSRTGLRVLSPMPLAEAEAVVVRLHDERSGLKLTRPGTVQWSLPEDDAWSIGCRFSQIITWETLGELFLNGVLAQDVPPAPPIEPDGPAPGGPL